MNAKLCKTLRSTARRLAKAPDELRYEDIVTRPKGFFAPTLEDPKRIVTLDVARPIRLKEGTARCIYKDLKRAHVR